MLIRFDIGKQTDAITHAYARQSGSEQNVIEIVECG